MSTCARPILMIAPPLIWLAPIVGGAATGGLPVGCALALRSAAWISQFRILGPLEADVAGRADPPRWPAAALGAGAPAARRESRRVDRPPRGRALRRGAAGERRDAGAPPDLGAAGLWSRIAVRRRRRVIETRPPGYRILVEPGRARSRSLRAAAEAAGRRSRRRRRGSSQALPRGARAVARRAARRSRVRAVRALRGRAAEELRLAVIGAVPRGRARARARR